MVGKKLIAICQSGGEFETTSDGMLSYKGGDAHAMEIDDKMKYKDFKMEVAEMFSCNLGNMVIKYFLPGNKKTLICISNDKDLKRMVKFHNDSDSVDIYIMVEEVVVAPDVSQMMGSRSSRTTLSEAEIPLDTSMTMMENVLEDKKSGLLLLDASFDLVGDTNLEGAVIDVADVMPLPNAVMGMQVGFPGSYDEHHSKAAQQWENNITGVGQRFNSVHEFREALRRYAIAHRFAFKYKKNDSHRVTVKCKAEGCPWRIHASRLSTTPLICIKKMNSTHTCEGSVGTSGYQATRSWVASIIKDKLKFFPNYKPKDIVNDIKEEYGVQLNYFQAWRGKEVAKEQLQGSYREAYSQLPFLCEKIMETNLGSAAVFVTKDDSSFHRLFVCFRASVYGFEQGCRPLLFLDSVFLKSKYQGSLLTATAADGDDGIFPVAFAVVDVESYDNWSWFLERLKDSLSTFRGFTFVADRERGLREAIAGIFRNEGEDDGVHHAFCLHYLSEQLVRDLKVQFSYEVKCLLVDDLYAAAHALSPEAFRMCVERMKNISVDAFEWVMESDPAHWSNAFFRGARYNLMNSNFGEPFYSWISEAHELPITQMVGGICGRIADLIHSRRAESVEWNGRLTPSMEERLEREKSKAGSLEVRVGEEGNGFEVDGETVDLENCDCSCKAWRVVGIPCRHAAAVIACHGMDHYDYCSRFFTTQCYRIAHSVAVRPVSGGADGGPWEKGAAAAQMVSPPPTLRPPGRPTTKRSGSSHQQEAVGRRQLQCSRCKGTGHNKSTCKE
ncbi:hypothetical protein M569_03760, partial [Genlisea aurea]